MADHEERSEERSNVLLKRSITTTLELPILLNIIAVSLTGAAINNILLYRACVHSLHNDETECVSFLSPVKTNETNKYEKEVQAYVSFVLTVKTVLEYICPALLSLFLGAWSDKYGRKPLMVWPLLGMAITGMLIVIFGMIEDLGPWWFIAAMAPFSLSGGYIVMFTGAYCYISDISSAKNTSLRMTIVDATTSLGSVVGSLLSSYLILAIGNIYLLLLAATLHVAAYVFTNIVIVESLAAVVRDGTNRVLDILLVKDMVRKCFQWRPNNGRAQIILLALAKMVSIWVLYGSSMLEYLYTREKLQWALQDYSFYSAVSTAIAFVGGFLGLMVVQKLLRVGDVAFTIIITILSIGELLLKLFATTKLDMYLSSVVAMFKGLSGPLLRSHLTKIIPTEDIAKVFAFLGTFESFSPIISPIIYNSLYTATLATFPGAVYLLSTVLTAISLVLLGFVHYFSWNMSSASYQQIEPETDA